MQPGQDVLAKGWVRTKRGNKQVKFIALNDGSTINNIQVVAEAKHFSEDLLKKPCSKRQARGVHRKRPTRGTQG